MAIASFLPRSACRIAASVLAIGSFHSLAAAERVVDFRYGIPTWHQPLGVPEDWHKPMANERGALLYDFGPGPYVQGLTVVEASAEGEAFAFASQDFLEAARVPIMRSTLTRGSDRIEVTTLSIAPEKVSESIGRTKDYERLDGISGAIDWAKPGEGVSL
ncbi:MAG: hypothetical protein NVV74_02385 [Magnetospirillum sp.]|nr:hypothetical protein [Magnetospirillum sp.]